MNTELDTFNRMLFLELRPWIFGRHPDLKFRQLLTELKKEYYQNQPEYELDFIRPFNNNRRFFKALIESEGIRFLNQLDTNVKDAINENAKKYFVHFALTRTLSQKLKETAKVIEERDYSPNQIDPQRGAPNRNTKLGNESYTIHFLKHQLVRLYMEVQEKYPLLLKEEFLSQDDIYLTYFNHPSPKPSYIHEVQKFNVKKTYTPDKAQGTKVFRPIADDFRAEAKGILPFASIIKNPARFESFESKLYDNGYIDENYNFINKHGFKNELAKIYLHLIGIGYFHKQLRPGNKKIKEVTIRKFLDHRYAADIDKQFRNFRKNPDAVVGFVDSQYWLSSLPPS